MLLETNNNSSVSSDRTDAAMLSSNVPKYESIDIVERTTSKTPEDDRKDGTSVNNSIEASTNEEKSYQNSEVLQITPETRAASTYGSDPPFYPLLNQKVYNTDVAKDSLIAEKKTPPPVMRFPPYFEVGVIFSIVLVGWFCYVMYSLDNPPIEPHQLAFPVTLGITIFLSVDIFFQLIVTVKNKNFPIQRYLVNCLLHHTCSILCLCAPLATDEDIYYKWGFILLSVELNTAFLKLRRIMSRNDPNWKYVNYSFYGTWILMRLIVFPFFCVYVWTYWIREKHAEFGWTLIGAINITILCMLYVLWTYNLKNKKKRKTKLGDQVSKIAIA